MTVLPHLTLSTDDTPTASVIWLHGLGADGHDFADIVPLLGLPTSLGIRFLFPHAPERPITINQHMVMRAWYDIYTLDDLKREDLAGLAASRQQVMALIEQERARGIACHRILLAGFSQGAALALHTAIQHPARLGGVLALSGYLPDAERILQHAHTANQHVPIFMAHGRYDPVIPLELAQSSAQQLEQAGFAVEWHTYAMQHAVCQEELSAIGEWISTTLKTSEL
jgi:phospholipase/carboxylesterase